MNRRLLAILLLVVFTVNLLPELSRASCAEGKIDGLTNIFDLADAAKFNPPSSEHRDSESGHSCHFGHCSHLVAVHDFYFSSENEYGIHRRWNPVKPVAHARPPRLRPPRLNVRF